MKHFYTLLLLALFSGYATGQPPAGYYDEALGFTGVELQVALHGIIKNHQVQTYASLFNHFQSTDRKPDLSVWDMYSDIPGGTPPYVYYFNAGMECGNYNGEGQCYNREHSWPQSWFGGSVLPMHTDLFHIYPTDGYVNNRRSNYPFGEVGTATWTSMNGSKVGNNISEGYSGVVFEPIDAYKGDLARGYFYMSVRYFGQDSNWPGSPMTDGAQLKPWALALMIHWHKNDPVSDKEINRNNAVYAIQQNRNPFIDYPEFVTSIWNDPSGVNDATLNRTVSVYPNPAHDFCHIHLTQVFSAGTEVLVFNQTGQMKNVNFSLKSNTIILATCGLPKGFYIVQIKHPGVEPVIARFIK